MNKKTLRRILKILALGILIIGVGILLVALVRPGIFTAALRTSSDATPVSDRGIADTSDVDRSVAALPVGDSLEHMVIDGERRTYTAYVPASAQSRTEPVDVLIVLHGTGGSGEGIRDVGFDEYADQFGFVIIYPDSLEQDGVAKWDPTNRKVKDVDFISAIIAELEQLSGGQLGNVYVAGMSNGSVMTQAMACAEATIDGIASVAAGMGEEMQQYCEVPEPIPYIGFYGTVDRFDELEKYESSVAFFAAANGCTDNYTSTPLPDIAPDDGATVELRTYTDARGAECAVPVNYYRIAGGGHFWPGSDTYRADRLRRNSGVVTQDIDATKLIVEFFNLDR